MPVAGNTERTHPANRAYYPALDGFRALAFLLVFGAHYLALPWGVSGVDAFFVLSGFLITGILWDTRDDQHRAYNFFLRRTLRIFPLYYGVILLMVFTYPIFRWDWNWKWLLWPAYLGNFARFVHPIHPGWPWQVLADAQPASRTFPRIRLLFGHFWSLCVEEQFYLVWPWIVFWIRDRRKLIYICLSSLVVCTALRVFSSDLLPAFMVTQEVVRRATPMRLDALLFGGFIALVLRGPHARFLLPAARIGIVVLSIVFVLWHLLAGPASCVYRGFVYPPGSGSWGFTLTEFFYGCVIILALRQHSPLSRALTIRPLRWLGRVSYGAYVFHDIFHLQWWAVANHFHSHKTLIVAVLGLSSTLVLAGASSRWYESRFIRLKDQWSKT